MIIGLTGTLGAGKGTVSEYLISKGFKHFSVRDFLTEKIKEKGWAINRDNMVYLANDLRKTFGPDYIVKELYDKAKKHENSIIESIRCPGEVEALRQKKDFYLFAIDADIGIRYSRTLERKTETDSISFETFIENEQREMSSKEPFEQNLAKCISMSDYLILNNKGIDDLNNKLENSVTIIDKDGRLKRRPDFDEIYMTNAYNWAAKSTCLRRHVGAVITLNNAEISQGYNGSPRGSKHCIELGCERERLKIPSGQMLEICRAVHAEPNAIINAGRSNRGVVGATVYSTTYPYNICAGLIVNSGISKVIYNSNYTNPFATEIFKNSKVDVIRYEGVMPSSFSKFFNLDKLV
ncbi:MAG: AAA family ATPase [Nanoarchaeota archaeon]|nr:AAA family ATPase [Nanoarchaeota archaeon]